MLTEAERDELLIRLDERTGQTHKALFGNGQPGIIHKVTVLEEDMRRRELEAFELREAVPSKKHKALLNSGVLTALLVAVFAALREVFGGAGG